MYVGKYAIHGWYGVYMFHIFIKFHCWYLLYQRVSRSDLKTSTFQGKAPPPPVAKGAGKVAFFGGNAGENMGFCLLSQSFLFGKKTTILEIGWCLFFVVLIFGVIISVKLFPLALVFFFVCVSYVWIASRSPWNQEMNPASKLRGLTDGTSTQSVCTVIGNGLGVYPYYTTDVMKYVSFLGFLGPLCYIHNVYFPRDS